MARSVSVPGTASPLPGKAVRVSVDGTAIGVFNVGGTLYAIEAKCTHVGGPLEQGGVTGTVVTCPWHGSQFDLKTGEARRGPATRPVRSFPVREENGALVVDLP